MKQMLINTKQPEESRIAVVNNNVLDMIFIERASALGHVGNIYKGKVVNIEPSIQAAFVDIGESRNGFLHVSDVMPVYGNLGKDAQQKTRKRERKIQDLLTNGANVLVQITKEGIGNKAPTLTTYLSIPGRYVVLMPSIKKAGVSRKIEDEETRRELRNILNDINPPSDMGYIIRTAGAGKNRSEIEQDMNHLLEIWKNIVRTAHYSKSPALIFQESDIVSRTLRDIFTEDTKEIIADTPESYQKALEFIESLCPEYRSCVKLYQEEIPLFHRYNLEDEIEKIYHKRVFLPSGGHLCIEQTEALIAIDVNSGKYTDEKDIEKTALTINLEAAEEIARQLRLRDLGGVIINDFIDMKDPRNRRTLERAFRDCISKDRARSRVGRISQFGIIEMTRQRLGPSIRRYTHEVCQHCNGRGWVQSIESICLSIFRKILLGIAVEKVKKIIITANQEVIRELGKEKGHSIKVLEKDTKTKVELVACDSLDGIENIKVEYLSVSNRTLNIDVEMNDEKYGKQARKY